jgi:hypothetical protein
MSYINSFHIVPSSFFNIHYIILLLYLDQPIGFFLLGFPTKISHPFPISPLWCLFHPSSTARSPHNYHAYVLVFQNMGLCTVVQSSTAIGHVVRTRWRKHWLYNGYSIKVSFINLNNFAFTGVNSNKMFRQMSKLLWVAPLISVNHTFATLNHEDRAMAKTG